MEKNQKIKSHTTFVDCLFLVYSGYLVWIWILSQYRMALESKGETGTI